MKRNHNWSKNKLLILLLIAIEPSLVADREDKEPSNAPIGVRATPAIHTSKKYHKLIKKVKKLGINFKPKY